MKENYFNGFKFYKFCPGVPWHFEDGSIKNPLIKREIWNALIANKNCYIIFPGLFLECLFVPLFVKVLKSNNLNVKGVIAPEYYNDFFNLFNIKNIATNETSTLFLEFKRIQNVTMSYPAPLFMDREDNIYFNMLYGYGKKLNNKGVIIERNEEPFWQQILKNTCCYPYNVVYPNIDKEYLKIRLNRYLAKFGINLNLPYIIIDDSSSKYILADGRKYIKKYTSPIKIKKIASTLFYKKYQLIILNSKGYGYYGFSNNDFRLPSWSDIKPDILMALLMNASLVYSSDPMIYLSAAFVGNLNVFGLGNFCEGFDLKNLEDVSLSGRKKNWVNSESDDVEKFIEILRK